MQKNNRSFYLALLRNVGVDQSDKSLEILMDIQIYIEFILFPNRTLEREIIVNSLEVPRDVAVVMLRRSGS